MRLSFIVTASLGAFDVTVMCGAETISGWVCRHFLGHRLTQSWVGGVGESAREGARESARHRWLPAHRVTERASKSHSNTAAAAAAAAPLRPDAVRPGPPPPPPSLERDGRRRQSERERQAERQTDSQSVRQSSVCATTTNRVIVVTDDRRQATDDLLTSRQQQPQAQHTLTTSSFYHLRLEQSCLGFPLSRHTQSSTKCLCGHLCILHSPRLKNTADSESRQ